MSLVINNNIMAYGAANSLNKHYANMSTSVARLSSGLRINGAADDAAGLAIREIMRSDIATLQQGMRNANDAISLIQTADGALGVIDEKLIRMKELAEQAATGSYDSVQRGIIDDEYQAMASEITRIANATDFNGIKLLDGTLSAAHDGSATDSVGELKVHFGTGNASAEDYYYINIGDSTASALGVGNQVGVTSVLQTAIGSGWNGADGTEEEFAGMASLQAHFTGTDNTITKVQMDAAYLLHMKFEGNKNDDQRDFLAKAAELFGVDEDQLSGTVVWASATKSPYNDVMGTYVYVTATEKLTKEESIEARDNGLMHSAANTNAGHSIRTQENAQKSLAALDDAIISKDKYRAGMGAMQNRLENTVSNLTIQRQNMQAAESRISDVDVASEMTNFVRNQVLTQAANSMLSQANSMPQMALSLLQG